MELIVTSGTRDLHVASIQTTKADPTFCALAGRLLLMVRTEALGPHRRATRWLQKQRDLSVLQLGRQVQAWAARWRQALWQSAFERRRFLHRAWATAERVVVKASRTRRTTAPSLRERGPTHGKAGLWTDVAKA
jgi:hypothetical protein